MNLQVGAVFCALQIAGDSLQHRGKSAQHADDLRLKRISPGSCRRTEEDGFSYRSFSGTKGFDSYLLGELDDGLITLNA